MPFWFKKIQLKIYSTVEIRKIVNNEMLCVKILLKQNQISKKKKKKKKKNHLKKILYLVINIGNNSIPAHFKGTFKILWYIENIFIQIDM